MSIFMQPTGNLIKGHVLDVSVGPLEQKLREYDAQLYVRWNPKKLKGWGCWEVRRKPEVMTAKPSIAPRVNPKGKEVKPGIVGDIYEFDKFTIIQPKYHEIDFVNHVMDVPYLNYLIFAKLKDMDSWKDSYKGKNFATDADYAEAKYDEHVEEKALVERNYNLKQFKKEIRYFREYILSGGNPYRLADYWDNKK